MSEPENFLSRWSRRKLEPEPEPDVAPRADEVASAPAATEVTGDTAPKPPVEAKPDEPEFDLTTLPSLESITAETDIRVFLQKGVPAQLTRAALRRAWSADPNIRDFREIAENQWDFATGADLPGFGPLEATTDEIRKMVAEVFGEGLKAPAEAVSKEAPSGPETPAITGPSETTARAAPPADPQDIAPDSKDQPPPQAAEIEPMEDTVQRNKVDVAMQQTNQDSEYQSLPTRRPHGRALPE